MPSKTIQVVLPEGLVEQIDRRADREGRTRSEMARELLKAQLRDEAAGLRIAGGGRDAA